jgi:hypothetical protein
VHEKKKEKEYASAVFASRAGQLQKLADFVRSNSLFNGGILSPLRSSKCDELPLQYTGEEQLISVLSAS